MNDSNNTLMKLYQRFIFLLLAAACLLPTGCATRRNQTADEQINPTPIVHAENEAQTKFGIFLTDNRDLWSLHGVDLAQIPLAPAPVISADDIISYDWSHHTMKLKPGVWSRVGGIPVRGVPFVVVADGERVYLGAFWTIVSSLPADVPTIMNGGSQNIATIYRGPGEDLRNDPRIKNALEELHKTSTPVSSNK